MYDYAFQVVYFSQVSPACTSPLPHTCYMHYSGPNDTPTTDQESANL